MCSFYKEMMVSSLWKTPHNGGADEKSDWRQLQVCCNTEEGEFEKGEGTKRRAKGINRAQDTERHL